MTQSLSSHSGVVDLMSVPGHGVLLAAGTGVPADAELGYSPGCLFVDVDASSGSQLHINIGTYASANFDPLAAEGALSKTGGTMTGTLTSQDIIIQNTYGILIGHTAQEVTSYNGSVDVTPEFQVLGTTSDDSSAMLLCSSATTTIAAAPILHLVKSDNGTIGTHTLVGSTTVLGAIQFHGDDGVDYESIGAEIRAEADGSVAVGQMPSRLILGTTSGANETVDDNLIINTDGNVTLDQFGSAANILTLSDSTDIATGMTTLPHGPDVTASTYGSFGKIADATGGLQIQGVSESSVGLAVSIEGWSGAPETTDTTASQGAILMFAGQHDNANGDADFAADTNLLVVGEIDSSSVKQARLLLKADDGELHLGNTTLVTLADEEDDVQLVRALQLNAAGPGTAGIVQSPYDNPLVNYDTLYELGIVGEKNPDDGFHFLRLQPCLALHAGAIWQMFNDMMDIAKALPGEMQKKLPERIRNRLTKEP